MFRFLKKDKIPKIYQSHFKPRADFVRQTESVFLQAHREKFAISAIRSTRWVLAMRLALLFVLFSGAIGGTAIYADAQDVGPVSMLYPLKRYSESARLVIAPKEEQENLHIVFAARRLNEIKVLKKNEGGKNNQRRQIEKLKEDLDVEVKLSTSESEEKDPKIDRGNKNRASNVVTSTLCNFVKNAENEDDNVATTSQILASNPKLVERAQKQCGNFPDKKIKEKRSQKDDHTEEGKIKNNNNKNDE